MPFPQERLRRLRRTPEMRAFTAETTVAPGDLVAPLFVREGAGVREPISALPGQFRFSPDTAAVEAGQLAELGIPAVLLFGIPNSKDESGSGAWDPRGPVPEALRRIKQSCPHMLTIADVCACEYTSHGHCGVLREGEVDNDQTLPLLQRAALCYAAAGADIIAPSDMMDGRVGALRQALDNEGCTQIPIMSYAAKFAGAFYGPFRDAAGSAPGQGDRRGYQMAVANRREALREIELDVQEGADMLLIKPGLFCLDIVREARERFALPLGAYNVSSEYAMVKAAGAQGWIDEMALVDDLLLSIKRAGADFIITYHAREWAARQK